MPPQIGPVDEWLKKSAQFLNVELEERLKHRFQQESLNKQSELHLELKASVEDVKREVAKPEEPHWTLTPSFIVIFVTMIFAAIAAWPIAQGWIQSASPENKAANSPPQQSSSIPESPTTNKTSPVAPIAIQGTNSQPK